MAKGLQCFCQSKSSALFLYGSQVCRTDWYVSQAEVDVMGTWLEFVPAICSSIQICVNFISMSVCDTAPTHERYYMQIVACD